MIDYSFKHRLAGLAGVVFVGLVPFACGGSQSDSSTINDSRTVGVPCTPGDESDPRFGGFRVTGDVLEPGAPECGGGTCLVNHFQGRVSCPLGQPSPKDAQGLEGCIPERDAQGNFVLGQGSCGLDPSDNKTTQRCVEAGSRSPSCDLGDHSADATQAANERCASLGAGSKCNEAGFCECATDADCLFVTDAVVSCDPKTRQCMTYACHTPGDCQQAGQPAQDNAGKACCVPGTDTPIVTAVCGQCRGQGGAAKRDAEHAVYCTCRCGVADGAPDEPDYPFCACPSGFECQDIRPNFGLGDPTLTGKYCILSGTAYATNQDQCGLVDGYWTSGGDTGASCKGVGSGQCNTKTGQCSPN